MVLEGNKTIKQLKMKKILFIGIALLALLCLDLRCQAQPIGHYGAHLGKYGLERYLTGRADYVKYIGQKVVVLQMNSERTSAEFEIKKLVGGIDYMTITLEECDSKANRKITISVSGESNTEYYITNETTVPLLLVDVFNQDKQLFVGRNYPLGSDNGNALGVITGFVLHNYNRGYPIPSYEITHNDSSKEYVPFDNDQYVIPNLELLAERIRSSCSIVPDLVIEEDGSITFNKVIVAENKTKDELFVSAMDFVVSEYKNAQKVIQFSDQDAGIIIGKGLDRINEKCNANHTLKIECRNGRIRVRYTLDNYDFGEIQEPITLRSPFVGNSSFYNTLFTSIVRSVNNSILEIEKKVKSGTSKIDTEDW